MTDAAEGRVGTTLGGFRLERLLGVGGMAAVYLGVDAGGRRRAVKVLHPEAAASSMVRARFEREAQVARRIRHPGAIDVEELAHAPGGVPFLVMDLLEGETLGERARRLGGISEPEMLRLVDELLDVLAVAHDAGIVHRDIKLDNLFVQSDGALKVLDFGVAHLGAGVPSLTRTGLALGTTPYMSPEQVRGERAIDGRSDLFAVGVLIFRLVSRRKVHEAESERRLAFRMATEPAPPLASVAPGAPPDLCLVTDRALVFSRDQRYPDARTMQRDVRALREGQAPPFASRRRGAEMKTTVATRREGAALPPPGTFGSTKTSRRPQAGRRRLGAWALAIGFGAMALAAGAALLVPEPEKATALTSEVLYARTSPVPARARPETPEGGTRARARSPSP